MSAPEDVEVVTGRIMRRQMERGMALACLLFGWTLVAVDGIFDVPLYRILNHFLTQQVYGALLICVGGARLLTLIVNGYWPVGPKVRLGLSVITCIVAWIPFTISFSWFSIEALGGHRPGAILPGVVLAPLIAWCELMCALALRAWIEAKKG